MVSQSLGAGSPKAAREITVRGLKVALGIAACSVAFMYFGQNFLLGLYSKETAVTSLAASLLVFGMIYHITDAAQTVSNFALRELSCHDVADDHLRCDALGRGLRRRILFCL